MLRPESHIQAIVTDLGQVLLRFDTAPCWEKLLAACEQPEARSRFHDVLVQSAFGCGRIPAEAFFQQAAAAMGLRMAFDEFCVAWSDMFWEDDETIDLIAQAPVRHRLVLSNTNVIHWDWIQRRYAHVLCRFDGCLVSHECGVEKPDAAIYQRVMRQTGLPPEAHLFIDDLPENVKGARAVGMEAVTHTHAGALREEFRRLGLLGE